MRIIQISAGRERYMELLLMGDEQREMVERYLDRGDMFVCFDGDEPVAVCVAVTDGDEWVEVMNLAVVPGRRRQGLGRAMLGFVEQRYRGRSIRLGTGETPSTLRFYESCGYRFSHRVPDFFTRNYDHPIIEEGVLLADMVYMVKRCGSPELPA